MTNCIVCNSALVFELFDPGPQPLTTLCIPKTAEEALSLPKLGMQHVICTSCGHIFNSQFESSNVDYSQDWQMYNTGASWQQYMDTIAYEVMSHVCLASGGRVLEIGSGDGAFLRTLSKYADGRNIRYVGIDPGVDLVIARRLNAEYNVAILRDHADFFNDIPYYRPGLIVMRHVLEHFSHPMSTIAALVEACQACEIQPYVFIEVPNGELILDDLRCQDLLYEHVSHFTESSLETLLRKHFCILWTRRDFHGSVLTVLARLRSKYSHHARAIKFQKCMRQQFETVPAALDTLTSVSDRQDWKYPVVFWGAIGKSASFFNFYQVDRNRYPVVVDSNEELVGYCIPGTGQEIQSPEILVTQSPHTIVITSAWRTRDIVTQIDTLGIQCQRVIYIANGQLIEYGRD